MPKRQADQTGEQVIPGDDPDAPDGWALSEVAGDPADGVGALKVGLGPTR